MGIQFYNSLSNYNSYSNYHREIPKVDPEQIKAQEVNSAASAPIENKNNEVEEISSANQSSVREIKNAQLEDISLTYNKEESFDYLNSDSSVKSLDMEKAISDMKKDSILQEYHYFVGSSNNLFSSDDGVVIAK